MATFYGIASGSTPGIQGDAGAGANGVKGYSTNGNSPVYGLATNSAASAVFGDNSATGGGWGVYGRSQSIYGTGVYGIGGHIGVSAVSTGDYGVYSQCDSGVGVLGNSNNVGVRGISGNIGVHGDSDWYGVQGEG